MRLTVFTEPQQGASYDLQRRVAQLAESSGYDAYFRSDHYLALGDGDGEPGPTDAWVTLAGLARETATIRLGTMVTSATFRLPGPLAISVAQVDAMSGGRVELGLGAGWFEGEHRAYGIPFPPTKERFERLDEQLAIITGLWGTAAGERFSFHGAHYDVVDSPGLPKPLQRPGPPVIVGGRGPTRTPAVAARYASEYNVPFSSLGDTAAAYDRVRAACDEQGRATPPLFSAAQSIVCGRDDAEVARRAKRIGQDPETLRERGLCGSPAQIVDRIGEYAQRGTARIHLQFWDMEDFEHIEYVASEVAPQVR